MVKNTKHSNNLYMNGPEVLKFSLNLVPLATKELLKKASLSQKDISLFLFHQASAVVLNKLKKKLKINDSQWFMDIENFGNTVSATIPIAISKLKENGKFPENIFHFHERLSGPGEIIIAIGILCGASSFGSFIQASGLIILYGIFKKISLKKNINSSIFFLVLLTAPIIIFLTSTAKPQLFFICSSLLTKTIL